VSALILLDVLDARRIVRDCVPRLREAAKVAAARGDREMSARLREDAALLDCAQKMLKHPAQSR
jgi:hypothetical protein